MSVINRLVRSGWWVALAGLAVALTILVLAMRAPSGHEENRIGDGRDPLTYGFDLSTSLVPAERITAAGMPRDGLTALHNPEMLTAAEVDALNQEGRGKFLLPSDRVLGVEVDGEARAYPLRFMRWHEVANDQLGGRQILVTYNPLCDAAVVCDRRVGSETLVFGASGLVYNSNLLLYDRRDDPGASSLWSQLDARAVAGPAAGQELSLELLPSALTTWGTWLENHASTLVLAPLERLKRVYKRDPYHSYFGSDLLRFPVKPLPTSGGLRLKDRVLILTVDGRETLFALRRIAEAEGAGEGTWETTADGLPIAVTYDLDRGGALVEWGDTGDHRVASRQAFWFAWYSHHPDTPPPGP